MIVGVLRLTFFIPHAQSLKEKRAVVRRFRDRIRARFHVSIAEVADQNLLQKAVFGVAVVSDSGPVCDQQMAKIARAAELVEDAQLVGHETELVPFGDALYGEDS